MAENNNIGPKRLVVGAHYGLRDWLSQRVTAIVMAVFTVILLIAFLTGKNFTYQGWAGLFASTWGGLPVMKLLTFVTFVALTWHAWVGVRDIWMDYVKPVGIRLALQVFTVFWLLACVVYAGLILLKV
ncbi:succinate dehydrogenase [beta proteobacterium AAP99]|nr:succinate dehydrogenase [beta proteobacterium AAP99]